MVMGEDAGNNEEKGQMILVDDLIVAIPNLSRDSKFGISPFTLNLTHKDAPLQRQILLDRTLRQQKDDDRGR